VDVVTIGVKVGERTAGMVETFVEAGTVGRRLMVLLTVAKVIET
jgi:hypothetical protein